MGFIKYKIYILLTMIRKIIYYFFNLFLFFLVIFLLCNLILDKEKTSQIFRFNFSRVSSDSMLPSMRVDDIVFFTILDENKCKLLKPSNPRTSDGDIIIFKADDSQFNQNELCYTDCHEPFHLIKNRVKLLHHITSHVLFPNHTLTLSHCSEL
ncbi:MAG: S24/S26 family peptidase, partial [Pigeon pea little leaf phytoplasma]|nr:S24/S26 family peptidase [Pigeon pea little leaf phytoplasma]